MRKFKMIIALLGLSLLLNGCSGINAKAAIGTANQQTQDLETKTSQTMGENKIQKNTEPADFTGEVSQIIGNEISLKLVKMPKMPDRMAMRQQDKAPENSNEHSSNEQEKNTPKAITGSTNTGFQGRAGGGFPGGGFPGGPGENRRSSANSIADSSAIKSTLKLDYTGEEKTITIPVGMHITSGRGQSGVTFDALQTGYVISVWLNDAGTVERARLIGGGTQ